MKVDRQLSWPTRSEYYYADIDIFTINRIVITENHESFYWIFYNIYWSFCGWFSIRIWYISRRSKCSWTQENCEQRQSNNLFHKYVLYNTNRYILPIKLYCQSILCSWQDRIFLYNFTHYENTRLSSPYYRPQKPAPPRLSLAPMIPRLCSLGKSCEVNVCHRRHWYEGQNNNLDTHSHSSGRIWESRVSADNRSGVDSRREARESVKNDDG